MDRGGTKVFTIKLKCWYAYLFKKISNDVTVSRKKNVKRLRFVQKIFKNDSV